MAAHPTRSRPPEELEAGLLALALAGGNGREAERQLALQGIKIPARTLSSWPKAHAERYAEVCNGNAKRIEVFVTALARQNALEAASVVSEAIRKAREGLGSPDVKSGEAARIAKDLSMVQGIQTDKLLTLEGRPTSIVRSERDADDIIESLQKLAPGVFQVIDGTAEEVAPRALEPPRDAST